VVLLCLLLASAPFGVFGATEVPVVVAQSISPVVITYNSTERTFHLVLDRPSQKLDIEIDAQGGMSIGQFLMSGSSFSKSNNPDGSISISQKLEDKQYDFVLHPADGSVTGDARLHVEEAAEGEKAAAEDGKMAAKDDITMTKSERKTKLDTSEPIGPRIGLKAPPKLYSRRKEAPDDSGSSSFCMYHRVGSLEYLAVSALLAATAFL